MDPITLIVTALVVGAAAGLSDTAAQAVKDAYAGLKSLIGRRYAAVDLVPLEEQPAALDARAAVAEQLAAGGAAADAELQAQAATLARLLAEHAPGAAPGVGIALADLEIAGSFRLRDVAGGSVDIDVSHVKTGGDFEIGGIRAGDDRSAADLKN